MSHHMVSVYILYIKNVLIFLIMHIQYDMIEDAVKFTTTIQPNFLIE